MYKKAEWGIGWDSQCIELPKIIIFTMIWYHATQWCGSDSVNNNFLFSVASVLSVVTMLMLFVIRNINTNQTMLNVIYFFVDTFNFVLNIERSFLAFPTKFHPFCLQTNDIYRGTFRGSVKVKVYCALTIENNKVKFPLKLEMK